jgi:hypothetical protein
MAHNSRCSNAKSPPRDCTCDCGGLLHGGGGQRLPDGSWGRSVEYKHNDRATCLGDSLDGPTVDFFDRLFRSSDAGLLDDASDLIANDITDHLGKRRSKRFREELRQDHTICSLMVAMVSALTTVGDAAPEVIETAVEGIIRRRPSGAVGPLDAKTAGKVAKLVVRKLQAATTLGSLPLYIKTCRCVAIVSCPVPADHNDVREYAEAQVKEMVTEELRHLLKETIEHWEGYGHSAERRDNLNFQTSQGSELRSFDVAPPRRSASHSAAMGSRSGSQHKEKFLSLATLKRRLGLGRPDDGKSSKGRN